MTDLNDEVLVDHLRLDEHYTHDEERDALVRIDPVGFYIRHPPQPYELDTDITPDDQLFQTIHMGAAVVDGLRWRLVVTGLVERPISLTLDQLRCLPSLSVTAFHECYGSPLAPPVKALHRIGNVRWTGVPLRHVLDLVRPLSTAQYVWSDGLDHGVFAGVAADRYQKDLPLAKAWQTECLIAYEINGMPLDKERGGCVRLVVPGWFGTNSTKWLCRLSLAAERCGGAYTTTFYNELDPRDTLGVKTRPVWEVEPNSMIVRPRPHEVISSGGGGAVVHVWGRAWGCHEIVRVDVSASVDGGPTRSYRAHVEPRTQFEWQRFSVDVVVVVAVAATTAIDKRQHVVVLTARATDIKGEQQPVSGRRNHVHCVTVAVE